MRNARVTLSVVAVMLLAAGAAGSQTNEPAAWGKLKSLEGQWQSTLSTGQTSTVSYQVMSSGSAVLEIINTLDEGNMVSVYHLDGERLMMTHYCGAGNQPRMVASVGGDANHLRFVTQSVTNLKDPNSGHMSAVEFTFRDANHVTQVWTWQDHGKETSETFQLERKK